MPKKQSSSRTSSLAGKYLHVTALYIRNLSRKGLFELARDLRALAGSVASQDEAKGQKPKRAAKKRRAR